MIWVRPVPRPAGQRAGKFEAYDGLTNLHMLTSRTPFLDGARWMLKHGSSPDTQIVMRHHGTDHDALRATVGAAAGLRVKEADLEPLRFMPWGIPAAWTEDRP